MDYIKYSMEVKNKYKINNLFGSKYYNNELALEVMKDEIMTNNHKLEEFYLNHKKELLSYKIKDLKKIFKDCSLKVLHLIKTKERKLIISDDSIRYLTLSSGNEIESDLIFHTYVEDLNKDNKGIYIILNGYKKYICDLKGIVYE